MTRIASLILLLVAAPLAAETTEYRALMAGEDIGHLIVDWSENRIAIERRRP